MAEAVTFFDLPKALSVADIAEQTGCHLREGDDGAALVHGVGPVEATPEGYLTFINNARYLKALGDTKATAVICAAAHAARVPGHIPAIISEKPYHTFAQVAAMLFPGGMRPQQVTGEGGVSESAFVDPSASLEDGVIVEPGAIVGKGVAIGAGSHIGPNAVIGHNVRIGRNTSIAVGATVSHAIIGDDVIIHTGVRIGSDGFGFAMGAGGHLKIPQVGRVVIQDHVEIGANSCIDRGANRDTVIGEGTKIDNLVQIGHNVVIGRHCILVAQSAIAGSAILEDYVVLGGSSGVNGHVTLGMGAQLAGCSNVAESMPAGERWAGTPAKPLKEWMRETRAIKKLMAQDDGKKGSGNAATDKREKATGDE